MRWSRFPCGAEHSQHFRSRATVLWRFLQARATVLCSAPPWRAPFAVLINEALHIAGCGTAGAARPAATQQEFSHERRYRHRQRGAHAGRRLQRRAFASLPAHELGKVAIKEALKRAGVEGGRVSEVIMGQILTAGQGQNPARQASIAAGIPVESPAWGVNQLCGSGLRAVALGYQAILNGDSDIVVAGGQESMSQAPHCQHLRNGVKMGGVRVGRHHDQGRPVGRLQRLPHGHHRRERRQAVADHARSSRTSSRSNRRTRPRPR